MKKKMVIIRFGSARTLAKEVMLMKTITDDLSSPAIGFPLAGIGIVSLVYTDSSKEEILACYRKLEEMTSDQLPVMVVELRDVALHLNHLCNLDKAMSQFEESCAEYDRGNGPGPEERPVVSCELGLDELLELVSQRGSFAALSPNEQQRLVELSKK